jgi:hypothetical protein
MTQVSSFTFDVSPTALINADRRIVQAQEIRHFHLGEPYRFTAALIIAETAAIAV